MGPHEGVVALSCSTLCDFRDCSLPGSSVHGILQARVLEWVAMPSSRGSSWPKDQVHVLNPGLPHCTQILYHLSHQGSSVETSITCYLKKYLSLILWNELCIPYLGKKKKKRNKHEPFSLYDGYTSQLWFPQFQVDQKFCRSHINTKSYTGNHPYSASISSEAVVRQGNNYAKGK